MNKESSDRDTPAEAKIHRIPDHFEHMCKVYGIADAEKNAILRWYRLGLKDGALAAPAPPKNADEDLAGSPSSAVRRPVGGVPSE